MEILSDLSIFKLTWNRLIYLIIGGAVMTAFFNGVSAAQTNSGAARYDIGSPSLIDVWVDPINGDDQNSGDSRSQALRSVNAAWNRIPQARTLTRGVRIMLMRGDYPVALLPNYWESRYGTAQAPIVLQGADGPATAVFRAGVNLFDLRYVYMIDFDIVPSRGGDAWHCEQCDHVLVRNSRLSGFDGNTRAAQETVKANQSRYVYFEDNDIGGAYDNAIDFVGVQSGHFLGNYIHDADDWCQYLKGGSAYFLIEGNRYANCGTGGFTAGQGTGFEFMTAPWLHYEAYDIKFVNNVIHDTAGAGIGINGGYNILMAHNTMYRVGSRSHGIEIVFGLRGCDGDISRCNANRAAGGWGTSARDEQPIPNRNVYIYNNILYNPPGFRSAYEHFAIYAARDAAAESNIPTPATTDTNLQIRGNIIWNGPSDMPLGVGGTDRGCANSNLSCNQTQLLTENSINQIEPQLRDAAHGDFRPLAGGNVLTRNGFDIPAFSGGDQPAVPAVPVGNLANQVGFDRGGVTRSGIVVGAYSDADSPLGERPGVGPGDGDGDDDSGDGVPIVGGVRASAVKSRRGVLISLRAIVSDSDGISAVTCRVHDPRAGLLADFSMRLRDGDNYRGRTLIRRAGRLKAVIISLNAQDSTGKSTTLSRRVKISP